MAFNNLHLKNFRSFEDSIYSLDSFTLITGKNGSGKSSVLEALHLLLKFRSFRTSSINSLINHNSDAFQLSCKNNTQIFSLEKKRRVKINKSGYQKDFDKFKTFPLLINNFSLAFLETNKDTRRDFLDYFMFHVKHDYLAEHKKFKKILSSRNRALKNKDEDQIALWTKLLTEQSELITQERKKIFDEIIPSIPAFLNELPLNDKWKEISSSLSFKFIKGWEGESLVEALRESYLADLEKGYTTIGPQKFDLEIKIFGNNSGNILSRGEQKLLILLVFLSFGDFFSNFDNKESIYLIDDLPSELDEENLSLALNALKKIKQQKIITSVKNIENIKFDSVIDL
jgi:DNA replication and repair protein RecF